MKKIIYIFIFSILLIFTFPDNNSHASNGERHIYEKINLVWDDNFRIYSRDIYSNYVQLSFYVESDLFINYKYKDDMSNSIFFHYELFDPDYKNAYKFLSLNPEILYGNRFYATVIIRKEYLYYYIEEFTGVATYEQFFEDWLEYEVDLSNYFKLYVRVDEEIIGRIEYNNGYDDGYADGYAQGVQVSQSDAYNEGYRNGASQSFMGSLDKWIVPSIIIVMLLGGFFAIARKKRDGDI